MAVWTLLVLAAISQTPASGPCAVGYVWPDGIDNACPIVYHPRVGDILLFSTREPWYLFTFGIARSGHPYHSGLVIRLHDGKLAMLESGGGGVQGVNVRLLEERLPFHFTEYADRKPIAWVRRLKSPLAEEQIEALTCFAKKHYTKEFSTTTRQSALALPRFLIRRTEPEQARWFCSEIVLEALKFAGVYRRDAFEPARNKPRDMYYDHGIDLADRYAAPVRWSCSPAVPPPGPCLAPR